MILIDLKNRRLDRNEGFRKEVDLSPGEGCVTRECLVFWIPLVGSVSFLVVLVAGYWILVSVILGFPGLIAGAIFKILNQ